jgi:hypothetical protein
MYFSHHQIKFMKKFIIPLFLSIAFLSVSCSSDSENTEESNFSIPINIGDYWTYDVDTEGTISRDSLFIQSEVQVNNFTYKKFETRNNTATGFYSSVLRNNKVRKNGSKLLLSGDVALSAQQNLPVNINLSLTDFVVFNSNAQNNQALNSSAVTGTINQTYNNYPLTITYSLQSYGGETFTSYTSPDGSNYSNVKSTKIKLNVGVTTVQNAGGISIPITVLAPQDFIISTLYLADGIGVVHVNTDTSYTINPLLPINLGIPSSATQNQKEYLDTYVIN